MRAMTCLAMMLILSGLVFAEHTVAVLDGTSWKVQVEPDAMAKEKGEKDFKDTLIFADGSLSATGRGQIGFGASSYSVSQDPKNKDFTFTSEQRSEHEGTTTWTGTIHEDHVEGKMIWTKANGAILTFTFKGEKLH